MIRINIKRQAEQKNYSALCYSLLSLVKVSRVSGGFFIAERVFLPIRIPVISTSAITTAAITAVRMIPGTRDDGAARSISCVGELSFGEVFSFEAEDEDTPFFFDAELFDDEEEAEEERETEEDVSPTETVIAADGEKSTNRASVETADSGVMMISVLSFPSALNR